METQTGPVLIEPVEFSDVGNSDECKWCDTELEKDRRGFLVCPHCDRVCGFNPCRECVTAAGKLPAEFTDDERATAALPPPDGHFWWPRRFWYAVRTWLPPWPVDYAAYRADDDDDEVDA